MLPTAMALLMLGAPHLSVRSELVGGLRVDAQGVAGTSRLGTDPVDVVVGVSGRSGATAYDLVLNPEFRDALLDPAPLVFNRRFAARLPETRQELRLFDLGAPELFYSRTVVAPRFVSQVATRRGGLRGSALFAWDAQPSAPLAGLYEGGLREDGQGATALVAHASATVLPGVEVSTHLAQRARLDGSRVNSVLGLVAETKLSDDVQAKAWGLTSHTYARGQPDRFGLGFGAWVGVTRGVWYADALLREVGDTLEMDLGFVDRPDHRFVQLGSGLRFDTGWSWLNQVQPHLGYERWSDRDALGLFGEGLQDDDLHIDLHTRWWNIGRLTLTAGHRSNRYVQTTEFSPYAAIEGAVHLQRPGGLRVEGSLRFEEGFGWRYDMSTPFFGPRRELVGALLVQPWSWLSTRFSVHWLALSRPVPSSPWQDGWVTRGEVHLHPYLGLYALGVVQALGDRRRLEGQAIIGWHLDPGFDVSLGGRTEWGWERPFSESGVTEIFARIARSW